MLMVFTDALRFIVYAGVISGLLYLVYRYVKKRRVAVPPRNMVTSNIIMPAPPRAPIYMYPAYGPRRIGGARFRAWRRGRRRRRGRFW